MSDFLCFKKVLTFPIDIFVSPSSNPDELEIEIERMIPHSINDNAYLYMQQSSNDL